jgi:hypothetical protein
MKAKEKYNQMLAQGHRTGTFMSTSYKKVSLKNRKSADVLSDQDRMAHFLGSNNPGDGLFKSNSCIRGKQLVIHKKKELLKQIEEAIKRQNKDLHRAM